MGMKPNERGKGNGAGCAGALAAALLLLAGVAVIVAVMLAPHLLGDGAPPRNPLPWGWRR